MKLAQCMPGMLGRRIGSPNYTVNSILVTCLHSFRSSHSQQRRKGADFPLPKKERLCCEPLFPRVTDFGYGQESLPSPLVSTDTLTRPE